MADLIGRGGTKSNFSFPRYVYFLGDWGRGTQSLVNPPHWLHQCGCTNVDLHITFWHLICFQVPLPLELIWLLHKQSTVTFDLFIKANLGSGETFKKLTKDFLSVILTDFSAGKEDLCQHIISGERLENLKC